MKIITKEIKTWKIKDTDLPPKVKDKILQKHGDINVDYEWYDGDCYFPEWLKGKVKYFDLDRANYCQWEIESVDYPALAKWLNEKMKTDQIKTGTYCLLVEGIEISLREETGAYRTSSTKPKLVGDYGDLAHIASDKESIHKNLLDDLYYPSEERDNDTEQDVEDQAQWERALRCATLLENILFFIQTEIDPLKLLKADYDYLTGEIAIIETLEANDYDFDEYGDIV